MAVTNSILIGRVIQGLEFTLLQTTVKSTPSSSSDTCPGPIAGDPPKLSWGELQIDRDEENQLKQHLWLLQFRKLKRVIQMLNTSVRQLTSSVSGGHSAYVMACQCIHKWLTQKADTLKARYDAQDGGRAIADLGVMH